MDKLLAYCGRVFKDVGDIWKRGGCGREKKGEKRGDVDGSTTREPHTIAQSPATTPKGEIA